MQMYRRPSRKVELTKRITAYTVMTVFVGLLVTFLIFIILGYRLDITNGHVERGALVQFESKPSGADALIDGEYIGVKTSGKYTVIEGTHVFSVKKDGYQTWTKTLDITAETLTWLDYIRLIPVNRIPEAVATYSNVQASLPSVDGKKVVIQQDGSKPTFTVVDISSDKPKTSSITLDKNLYSSPESDTKHVFIADIWDSSDRYLIVKHIYSSSVEWLMVDTQNVARSKNITRLLDINITKAVFSGTSGNIIYALTDGDIRKLDLSAETISRSLVRNVTDFKLFNTNIITYVGYNQSSKAKEVVGLYREGDEEPHVLRTVDNPKTKLDIDTARYFNQDYVAIAEGKKVDILSGSYPASGSSDSSSLSEYDSFTLKSDVSELLFSPEGFYLLAQSGVNFVGYDIEHKLARDASILGDSAKGDSLSLKWLDDSHLWSSRGGVLNMYDFDGTNAIELNNMVAGYAALLSSDEKFIYSIDKVTGGYQLQRVRIVL